MIAGAQSMDEGLARETAINAVKAKHDPTKTKEFTVDTYYPRFLDGRLAVVGFKMTEEDGKEELLENYVFITESDTTVCFDSDDLIKAMRFREKKSPVYELLTTFPAIRRECGNSIFYEH
jgi:hypothetical protein